MNKKQPLPMETIEEIFRRLHGRFTNRFIDGYRIGELDENGRDKGVENAKLQWSRKLAGISNERLARGLEHDFGEHPPSCDAFKLACVPVPTMYRTYAALPLKREKETRRVGDILNNLNLQKGNSNEVTAVQKP